MYVMCARTKPEKQRDEDPVDLDGADGRTRRNEGIYRKTTHPRVIVPQKMFLKTTKALLSN